MRSPSLLCLLAFAFLAGTFALATQEQQPLVSGGLVYSNCGLPTAPVQVESIQISPDPPRPGRDLTVTVKTRVLETVKEGAFADVVVRLGPIKLLTRRFDVCEEARNANASMQCPVAPGLYTVKHTVTLPREIPRAKFIVQIRGYTVEGDDMLCLDLKVDFMRPFTM